MDRGRIDELVELFTEDGTLEAGDAPARGREAIRAFLLQTKAQLASATERPLVRHHVSNLLIDVVSAGSARAASYFLVLTAERLDHWGRYRDLLVEVGGRWLFQHRRVRTDGYTSDSWVRRNRREPY